MEVSGALRPPSGTATKAMFCLTNFDFDDKWVAGSLKYEIRLAAMGQRL